MIFTNPGCTIINFMSELSWHCPRSKRKPVVQLSTSICSWTGCYRPTGLTAREHHSVCACINCRVIGTMHAFRRSCFRCLLLNDHACS